jgi:hypothetical protein
LKEYGIERTLWFEIKPGDQGKNDLFTEFIMAGPDEWCGSILNDIPDPQYVMQSNGGYYEYGRRDSDRPYALFGGGGWDNFYRFCICDSCGEVGYQFDGRSARIGCDCAIHNDSDKNYTADHPKIVSAFAKARAARFEHDARETYA